MQKGGWKNRAGHGEGYVNGVCEEKVNFGVCFGAEWKRKKVEEVEEEYKLREMVAGVVRWKG